MLKINIPGLELYDEVKEEFIEIKGQTIALEHSLVSISKWESKWKVPFLNNKNMTSEQVLDYVRCMTLTQNVHPLLYTNLNQEHIEAIRKYIDDPMTATWFSDSKKSPSREIVTSEVIYYWMIESNVPMECQKWHLNRLLTLIKVVNDKREPNKKKMSRREIYKQNAALNAARKARLHTHG